ncbi:MAG: uridine monophosphate kinase [Patescibacteria group bacterium]
MTKKILIKLSGEALANGGSNYREDVLADITTQVSHLMEAGHQVALVPGGGNLFRGKELIERVNVKRPTADYIGMLAIVQNSLVLRDYFESHGTQARVCSAITMQRVCEPYIPLRVERHLEKGRVVILSAGTGNPYVSSDTTSVMRALELGFDRVVMAKNGIDGVYTADPKIDPTATKIKRITASEILEKQLGFADAAAVSLALENNLPLQVISMNDIDKLEQEDIGTMVIPE